jgi:hypothetical protein
VVKARLPILLQEKDLTESFMRSAVVEGVLADMSASQVLTLLRRVRMSETDTLSDFKARLERICNAIKKGDGADRYPRESELTRVFVDNLSVKLKSYMKFKAMDPPMISLKSCYEYIVSKISDKPEYDTFVPSTPEAEKKEAFLFKANSFTWKQRANDRFNKDVRDVDRPSCNHCGRSNHSSEDCFFKPRDRSSNREGSARGRSDGPRRAFEPRGQSRGGFRSQRGGRLRFRGRDKGRPESSGRNRDIVCHYCNKKGHKQADCYSLKGDRRPRDAARMVADGYSSHDDHSAQSARRSSKNG